MENKYIQKITEQIKQFEINEIEKTIDDYFENVKYRDGDDTPIIMMFIKKIVRKMCFADIDEIIGIIESKNVESNIYKYFDSRNKQKETKIYNDDDFDIIENGEDIKKGDIIKYGGTAYSKTSIFYGQPVLRRVRKIMRRKTKDKKHDAEGDNFNLVDQREVKEYTFHCEDINTGEETRLKCKFVPSECLPWKYMK